MSLSNESIQEQIETVEADQDQLTVVPAPAPTPAEIDPDDAELAAAIAAVEAEKAAATGESTEESAPGEGQQTAPNAPPATAPKDRGPVPMIPKPRLDEVLRERDEAAQRAAYLQGQLEATKAMLQQGQTPTPQQPAAPQPRQATPQEKLAQVHQAIDQLAAKFDNGDITYAELKRLERQLANTETQIREDLLLQKVTPPAPQGDQLYLDSLTAQLEKDHPWVIQFQDETHFNLIVAEAKKALNEAGVQLSNDDMGKFQLRKAIAEQADVWGPRLYPNVSPTSKTAPAQPPRPSATATARADKLALAETLPPDITGLASQGGAMHAGDYSDAAIANMTDDEIDALPVAVRRKFLGS